MTSPTPTQTVDDIRAAAWVIPGDDNARADGSLDAMAWEEGEFTKPLYDAATIARMRERIAALEAENANLNAGIKRLSDEEEFFSENGRDGMLTAVHIGARLAEAEKLARTMEAEANQMREVSISNRHRAEACEEILRCVCGHLELPQSESGPADDMCLYDRALEQSDVMYRETEAERVEHMNARYKAEADLAEARKVIDRICADAKRRDLHGNGALDDVVAPYLINEARAFLAKEK